jgi:hypothetical protein
MSAGKKESKPKQKTLMNNQSIVTAAREVEVGTE